MRYLQNNYSLVKIWINLFFLISSRQKGFSQELQVASNPSSLFREEVRQLHVQCNRVALLLQFLFMFCFALVIALSTLWAERQSRNWNWNNKCSCFSCYLVWFKKKKELTWDSLLNGSLAVSVSGIPSLKLQGRRVAIVKAFLSN